MRLIFLIILLSSCADVYIEYPDGNRLYWGETYYPTEKELESAEFRVEILLELYSLDIEEVAYATGLNSDELLGIYFGGEATPYQREKLGL